MEKQIKLTDEIYDIIDDAIGNLVGEEYFQSEIEDAVTNALGSKCRMYDESIDEGCDDDETDDYVMKSCFEIENSNIIIRVYYGDITHEIAYIAVNDDCIITPNI